MTEMVREKQISGMIRFCQDYQQNIPEHLPILRLFDGFNILHTLSGGLIYSERL